MQLPLPRFSLSKFSFEGQKHRTPRRGELSLSLSFLKFFPSLSPNKVYIISCFETPNHGLRVSNTFASNTCQQLDNLRIELVGKSTAAIKAAALCAKFGTSVLEGIEICTMKVDKVESLRGN